ncbi:MAG: hypothetical protein U0R27_02240 [Candidatus Nanopelagicales bacterium]
MHSTLDVWNDRLVQFGADIVAGRLRPAGRDCAADVQAYSQVASTRNDVAMAYTAARLPDLSDDIGQRMRETLDAIRGEELAEVTLLETTATTWS